MIISTIYHVDTFHLNKNKQSELIINCSVNCEIH